MFSRLQSLLVNARISALGLKVASREAQNFFNRITAPTSIRGKLVRASFSEIATYDQTVVQGNDLGKFQ